MVEDSSALFRVDSIEFEIHDAFDDAKSHTAADRFVYRLMNRLHYETREGVVRKLLLFQTGDTISLSQLIESERVLRSQKILSTARIESRKGQLGENIIHVVTSDNWTTSIPISLTRPSGHWIGYVGLLESNIVGLGQSVGLYYAHESERDRYILEYGNAHFLYPNNRLNASWEITSDGYRGSLFVGKPFLSRSRNEWAYTLEALSVKRDEGRYWSDATLPARVWYDSSNAPKARTYQPGVATNPLLVWKGVRDDSVSFRTGRSFGSGIRTFVRGTYDFRRTAVQQEPVPYLIQYAEDGRFWTLDSSKVALDSFMNRKQDSRLGIAITMSRLNYTKLRNYHKAKWIEDVDKGWSLSGQMSRNAIALGASDNRWFCSGGAAMNVGSGWAHLMLRSFMESYLRAEDFTAEEIYGRLNGEFMIKPSEQFSTVLSSLMDGWRRAPVGEQLYLDGFSGMSGLPNYLLAGQGRYLVGLEQRWFPSFEIGTIVPVFSAFVNAGQVFPTIDQLESRDFQVVTGLGLHLSMSKSVDGVVNHLNLSWPVRGPYPRSYKPDFSVLASISL